MMVTEVKSCRFCGSPDLLPVLDLGTQVPAGYFPAADEADPPAVPFRLVRCHDAGSPRACGLLQLKHSIIPDALY